MKKGAQCSGAALQPAQAHDGNRSDPCKWRRSADGGCNTVRHTPCRIQRQWRSPENDELILWKLYNRKDNPDEGGSGFWEDTGHGPDTANDGLLRFYAPTGKVYIYLLANTKGTLFDFYKVGDDYVADDENIKMTNRADFFHIIQPKWKENLVPTDGILPMTGMADNKDGRCFIGIPVTQTGEKDKGSIWYQKDGTEEWTEISPDMDEEEHSFMLRRMVSKVTFNIKTGTPDNDKGATIKFTPP